MRRIVFFGNCQAGIIERLYRSRIAPKHADEVTWLRAWLPLTDADHSQLSNADLILEQVSSRPFVSDLDAYAYHPGLKRFPSVYMSFLWPTGNQPHPLNDAILGRPQGPFELNSGDSYLNMKMASGADMDVALEEYFHGNPFGSSSRLDRYYELYMGQQRSMDERTGFNFADDMEARFRTEQLFVTFSHLTLPFARTYIASVLQRLVCCKEDAWGLVHGLERSPFDLAELPVHPVIAEHFALQWAGVTRRYVTFTGDRLDHQEYFRRYVRYEWNRRLADLLHAAQQAKLPDIEPLIEDLADCLRESGDSALGYAVLGELNMRCSRFEAAAAACEQSLSIDSEQSSVLLRLAQCNGRLGNWPAAEAAIMSALRLSPTSPECLHIYSQVLAHGGRLDEAITAAKRAVAFASRHAPYLHQLALLLNRHGQAAAAASLLEAAISRDPKLRGPLSGGLAQIFEQQKQFDKAIEVYTGLLSDIPADREASRKLAGLLMRQGQHTAAEAVLRDAIAHAAADDAELLHLLSRALHNQQKSAEALAYAARSVELVPDHAYYIRHLADLKDAFGDREGAITLLERAVTLVPQDDNLRQALTRAKGTARSASPSAHG